MQSRSEATSVASSCQCLFLKERESQGSGTYIVYALWKLTYFSAMKINTRFIQWTKFHSVLSYNQVTPPNDQALGLMPINIPARGVNSGFSIGLGGWAPKVWSFQDVHRPRGSLPDNNQQNSFTCIFSLSYLRSKMFWNAAGPTNFT